MLQKKSVCKVCRSRGRFLRNYSSCVLHRIIALIFVKTHLKIFKHSPDGMWSPRELFSFRCLDEADTLENAIRDFLRSIYYVLESRRLDLSFEKLENPPYLTLAVEQKYRMGVENKSSKIFKYVCRNLITTIISVPVI